MDGTIIILYFGGSNNIFADCIYSTNYSNVSFDLNHRHHASQKSMTCQFLHHVMISQTSNGILSKYPYLNYSFSNCSLRQIYFRQCQKLESMEDNKVFILNFFFLFKLLLSKFARKKGLWQLSYFYMRFCLSYAIITKIVKFQIFPFNYYLQQIY